MSLMDSLILAVVEGLTEYLPISSTGHLILTAWGLGLLGDDFVKDFTVMVQFGAILAVLLLYWRKFLTNSKLYPLLFFAFLPAAGVGLAVKKKIDYLLGSAWIVAMALVVGGVLLVLTDKWMKTRQPSQTLESLTSKKAFWIGVFQTLAFIPGVSRAAATIWGGLYFGLSLKSATEFSFFLAVPTLAAASFLKLLKVWDSLTPEKIEVLLLGNLISFVVGALAIKFFVELVSRFGLKYFGYYRIILGLIVIVILLQGESLVLF